MTAWEIMLAFPYCTPGIGDIAFDQVYGKDSMLRLVYHSRDSFFHVGHGRRDTLVKDNGRLDPLIARHRARRNSHELVATPPGQHSPGLVRHVGRVVVESFPGPAVWMGVCAGCPAVEAAIAAVCGACSRNALLARGRSEPLHPL
jgi:hypothetical protein